MKKIVFSLVIILSLVLVTGCFKRDTMEDIDIYTTVYPIEYITTRLYGEHSNIYSIYPDGVNVDEYKPTAKQLADYSKASLYIFNGSNDERNYVKDMFSHNKNLKIINASENAEYNYDMAEIWLDPNNFLWLAQNIRNGLIKYINWNHLKNSIEENYDELKLEISTLDANFKITTEKIENKNIVVSNDAWLFLNKYGLNVISLEENENLTEKAISDVKDLIADKQISYIFVTAGEKENATVKKIVDETKIETLELNTLANLTEDARNANADYISLMNENFSLIKQELYN